MTVPISVTVPANNVRSPRYMEKALAAIHQANHARQSFVLEYASCKNHVGLFLRFPDALQSLVCGPLIANYPQASLTAIADDSLSGLETWFADLRLEPELFPVLRHAQFEDQLNRTFADPIDGVLQSLIYSEEGMRCRVEFTVRPAKPSLRLAGLKATERLDRPFFQTHHRLAHWYATHITRPRAWIVAWLLGLLVRGDARHSHANLEQSAGQRHEREHDLQAAADKFGGHLFEVSLRLICEAPPGSNEKAIERLHIMAGAFGAFTRSRLATFHLSPVRSGNPAIGKRRSFLCSHEELATLFHPPYSTVNVETLAVSQFTEREPPTTFPSGLGDGEVVLGRVRFRDDRRLVGFDRDARRRHLYVIGKTGVGKTSFLQNQILADALSGRGLGVVDIHGDLADSLVRLMPRHRTNDVVLFDATSREYAIPFNPLFCRDDRRIDQVTSGVVSSFRRLTDSWGPRLEDTMRNAVFAIVEQRGTLLDVLRLLSEDAYRAQITPRIRDEVVRAFWQEEFAQWNKRYRIEAVAAIVNKIRPFLTNRILREIVTQKNASLDLRQIMDEGRILIVNLSKGKLGEDNAMLLGSFLITALQQAAMTRADVPEEERCDFALYVDEFQNYSTTAFASILSEARKMRLNLVIAHQHLSQLDEQTRESVFGNVGSMAIFQVGIEDAELLSRQLSKFVGQVLPQDLANLPKYVAYVRTLLDGLPSQPFTIETLPPPRIEDDRSELVIRASQRQFGRVLTAA